MCLHVYVYVTHICPCVSWLNNHSHALWRRYRAHTYVYVWMTHICLCESWLNDHWAMTQWVTERVWMLIHIFMCEWHAYVYVSHDSMIIESWLSESLRECEYSFIYLCVNDTLWSFKLSLIIHRDTHMSMWVTTLWSFIEIHICLCESWLYDHRVMTLWS